jgi:hypothetical protein
MQAFRDIGALAELRVVVVPLIQGSGVPPAPAGIERIVPQTGVDANVPRRRDRILVPPIGGTIPL